MGPGSADDQRAAPASGVPAGDSVEVNVAASLLDIADNDPSPETWDQAAEGTGRIFQTFERDRRPLLRRGDAHRQGRGLCDLVRTPRRWV
jgi:hypothetical protein